MEQYIEKDGTKLKLGYTTGSCAAAAAKASAWMLMTGTKKHRIKLVTPKGIELDFEVEEVQQNPEQVSCAIRKDAGDDPDVTHGSLIVATVKKIDVGISILGGQGVGVVTKKGLDQPVGEAAINSVPRQMIQENLQDVMELFDYRGGFEVLISVPDGESLAKKTFNPRLGIEGGISIIGTTGIVEPMSEKALVDTIYVELRQKYEMGQEVALLTPGNYGSAYIDLGLELDPEDAVLTSNFIADSLRYAKKIGFKEALLVGHVGKLIKVAAGITNTHSKYGDSRMEIIAAHGAIAGLSTEGASYVLQSVTCDEAITRLKGEGCFETAFSSVMEAVQKHLNYFVEDMVVGAILFSKVHGELGRTIEATSLLNKIRRT